jgi:hypothetical protein
MVIFWIGPLLPPSALATVQYLQENKTYMGKYEIVYPDTGPNNRFYWFCHYQSMADQEKDIELRGNDPEWSKVFEAVNQTVDVDTVTSQMFRVYE